MTGSSGEGDGNGDGDGAEYTAGELLQESLSQRDEYDEHYKKFQEICKTINDVDQLNPLIDPIYMPVGDHSHYDAYFIELNFIAMGAFGVIASCKNKFDKMKYAVKKISVSFAGVRIQRLLREAEALSKIQHPNVVRYYHTWIESKMRGRFSDPEGVGQSRLSQKDIESPCLYILMEYCPRSLEAFLMNVEYDEERSWELFRQILRGVGHIHRQGYIHGDLSTRNILLDRDDNVKIADFGLARPVDVEGHAVKSNSFGMMYYRAPECEKGEMIDTKADMYSLGLICAELHHMCSTHSERLHLLSTLRATGPSDEWVDIDIINRLMSVQPSDRPCAMDLLTELGG